MPYVMDILGRGEVEDRLEILVCWSDPVLDDDEASKLHLLLGEVELL